VGIDLHRRRSVIVRKGADGEVLEQVRIDNDPIALACEIEKAGPSAICASGCRLLASPQTGFRPSKRQPRSAGETPVTPLLQLRPRTRVR
jgi:hypothetical protein